MLVQRAVGRHGGEYRYLFCFSRQNQNCDAPYIQVDDIEGGRPEPLRHHHLPPRFRRAVRTKLDETLAN
jgi:hypothetical protein